MTERAFPQCTYNMKGGYDTYGGMTLRQYYAAHAPDAPDWFRGGERNMRSLIEWRWYYADEMLKELEVGS